jgi:dTMP kinase
VRGRFITLEGGEGAGKSTQSRRLADALRQRGLTVVETREPGGSTGAEAIRALLLGGENDRWSVAAEALLFAAARADHLERTIIPALERGEWVICDRFIDSSLAYQAYAGGIGEEAVRKLHEVGSGGRYPDRTFLLELASGAASERARDRDGGVGDRIGGRDSDFHDAVAAGFEALANAEPQRIRRIDASGPPEAVTQRLLDAIQDLL